MEARATLRYNRQSPRKVRKVLNQVRGFNVGNAINYLHFSSEKASVAIEKTIRSAVANLLQLDGNNDIDTDLIRIKKLCDQGPVMKRFVLHQWGEHLNFVGLKSLNYNFNYRIVNEEKNWDKKHIQ